MSATYIHIEVGQDSHATVQVDPPKVAWSGSLSVTVDGTTVSFGAASESGFRALLDTIESAVREERVRASEARERSARIYAAVHAEPMP